MDILYQLSFGFSPKLPVFLQTEATECGLACLGMIAGYHGYTTNISTLRRQFPVSLKGSTLADLVRVARLLHMDTRPLKLDLPSLTKLRLPCILHWNFDHFVVLKEVTSKKVVIHDPAFGVRSLLISELSDSFTGVALELWPTPHFEAKAEPKRTLRLGSLLGRVTGLKSIFLQILLLAVGIEIFSLVIPFFTQWTLDYAIVSNDSDLLITLCIGYGLVLIIQQTITYARSWIIMYMGTNLNVQWRANIFGHLTKLPVNYFMTRHLGDVLSRFGAVDQIQKTLTTSFLAAILDGLMTIATLVLMFLYSPTLAWIGISAMALYLLLRIGSYTPLRSATEAQIIATAKQQSHFLETIRGIKTIKLFEREEGRKLSWLSLFIDQTNAGIKTQKAALLYQSANSVLFGFERILSLGFGAHLVMSGHFTVGVLMAYTSYKEQFSSRVSSLIDKYYEVKFLGLQSERLADIVLEEPEPTREYSGISDDADLSPTIEVSHLSFRYASQDPLVLDNINFKIEAGSSVALAGPSGGGKTTLVNILLGILPPTGGDVMVGGVSLKRLGADALRRSAGTVTQDDVLFAGSIADNICFFDPAIDQIWIEECAGLAAIHTDIVAMPMGYRTLVGDMGTVLSGGQKQRVLLARALYKRPKFLILDEATSHLDVELEQRVNDAIRSLKITRILVAHRPETIASADRVLVLRNKSIMRDMSVVEGTIPDDVGEETEGGFLSNEQFA